MNNAISERLRKVYINLDNDGDEYDSCDDIASAIAEIERLTSEIEQANDIRDTWRIWLEMMRDSLGIEGTLQQRVFEDMLEVIEQAKAPPVAVPKVVAHRWVYDDGRVSDWVDGAAGTAASAVAKGFHGHAELAYPAPPAPAVDEQQD